MKHSKTALCAVGVLVVGSALACSPVESGRATTTTERRGFTTTIATSTPTTPPDTPERPTLVNPIVCRNELDGYSISYPEAWSTNSGDVVPPCSLFDPEPFVVPESSDARPAAISVYREDVPFTRLSSSPGTAETASFVVDGRPAVRVASVIDDDGLYPAGSRFVRYAIDLATGDGGAGGTHVADVVETAGLAHYHEAVLTLDLMLPTLELDGRGAEPNAVAAFERGETTLVVVGDAYGDRVCFSLAGAAEPLTCMESAATIGSLDAPIDVAVGTASAAVFRVEAVLANFTVGALPVPLDNCECYPWALPINIDDVEELVHYDIEGNVVHREPIDRPGPAQPAPVAPFGVGHLMSEGYPGSGQAAFLSDVSISGYERFDRVVFSFEGEIDDLTFSIESTEEVRAISGQPVPVGGDSMLAVRFSPASRVDLSGEVPVVYYHGPDRIEGPGSPLVEVVLVSDFEQLTTWALGVRRLVEYAIAIHPDDARLVIDVRSISNA